MPRLTEEQIRMWNLEPFRELIDSLEGDTYVTSCCECAMRNDMILRLIEVAKEEAKYRRR